MDRRLRRKLAIGGVTVAALGGAGAAYGVTQGGGNERQAFLNDAAGRLHVTPQQLQSALTKAFEDRLEAAVKAGRLTQAQADAIKRRIERRGGLPFGGRRLFLHRGPGLIFRDGFHAAATYLGLTDTQLGSRLRSGKSLADIAAQQRKSVSGLEGAIRAAVKSDLDSAVKAGRLTQAQENEILGRLDSRLSKLVNRRGLGPRFHAHPFGARRGGMWFGTAPGGPPPPPGGPIS